MLAGIGMRAGQAVALALILAGGLVPALAESAGMDEHGRTPLQRSVWCSTALTHFMARGDFDDKVASFDRADASAAIVHYDDLVAKFAENEGLSVRDTVAMLSAERRRFIAEIEAPESDADKVQTGLVACVAIAKFTGNPAFDLGFDLVLE
jgi:hypothetical protein